jgi:CheY-like chemotaxis protein
MFPDLAQYRIVVVDDRAETAAVITAILSVTGAELMLADTSDGAASLIRSSQPSLVLVATAIAGAPFAVVRVARDNDVPVLALDLGSVGPEITDRLRRECGIDVLRTVDDPEALCHAAKRAADHADAPRTFGDGGAGRAAGVHLN